MRRATQILLALGLAIAAQGQDRKGKLHCIGQKAITTKFAPTGPLIKQEDSKYEIWLSRRNGFLLVQVNPEMYKTLDAKTRHVLQEPELYRVVGETGEGLTATHIASLATTEHTLILKADHKEAIWIETAFSFLPPQSEPVSTTVALTCKDTE